MKSKIRNILFILVLLLTLLLLLSIFFSVFKVIKNSSVERDESMDNTFTFNMIREVNNNYKNTNYLISPYSIEVALSMVREGASSTTLEELEKVVPERDIEDIRIDKRINVANALFLKDTYKDSINLDYKNKLKNNYHSEILIDKYETPKVINDWVNKETSGMIDKVVDDIGKDFIMGLSNAVALDVEWKSEFDCNKTHKDIFTSNGKKIDVAMMSNSYKHSASYFDTDYEKGIILPYKDYNNSKLEFIGIIPKTDINSYINKMNDNVIKEIYDNKISSSSDLTINLKLPRFSYSFDYSDFKSGLEDMGLKDIFKSTADFSKISNMDLYINQAVHKTFIDLSEKGTKAAAVTYFGFDKSSIELDTNEVDITFDKPFIYMIKYNDEIVFFGVVYEPEEWTNKTITCKED